MVTYICNLLLISTIITLIHNSGFFINLDNWIESKYKFHHLPHIFKCDNCQVFWFSVIYTLIFGKITLISVCFCILNYYTPNLILPIFNLIINLFNKIIEQINKYI